MKKLLHLLLIAPVLGFGQGEQLYADGTATDQDGNTFEWINYGTQDWSIENAKVAHYRDGTSIPQVTYDSEWSNLTIGAWCYYNNDSTKGKLYNWYAVVGIHDNDENTPNKEFAPEGWRVPSNDEWTTLENFLITNVYNYDGTTTGNKIAKSMSSITGWFMSPDVGDSGNEQNLNNKSGFNSLPIGYRKSWGLFEKETETSYFHSVSEFSSTLSYYSSLNFHLTKLTRNYNYKKSGGSVRFVRESSTASITEIKSTISVYPNPTSATIEIQQEFSVAKVYDLSGKELLKSNSKTIDLSELPSSVYLLRLYDDSNKVLGTTKVVKH